MERVIKFCLLKIIEVFGIGYLVPYILGGLSMALINFDMMWCIWFTGVVFIVTVAMACVWIFILCLALYVLIVNQGDRRYPCSWDGIIIRWIQSNWELAGRINGAK